MCSAVSLPVSLSLPLSLSVYFSLCLTSFFSLRAICQRRFRLCFGLCREFLTGRLTWPFKHICRHCPATVPAMSSLLSMCVCVVCVLCVPWPDSVLIRSPCCLWPQHKTDVAIRHPPPPSRFVVEKTMKTTLGQSHDVWPLVVPRLAPFWPYCLATLALAIKCMAHATWRKAHGTLFFFFFLFAKLGKFRNHRC